MFPQLSKPVQKMVLEIQDRKMRGGKQFPKKIRFRKRDEEVLEIIRLRGRRYFVLEKLSRRGAYRVFDPGAALGGDYRVLHRSSYSKTTRQKIEVLRRLTGPTANRNFPRIFESGRHDEDFLVVTEWVYGKNLKAVLEEVRAGKIPRPSVPEVVRLIRGLAHGLAHYHRRANLIHGDVSPANILVTDGTRNLVLIDFGTAWPIELTAAKSAGDGVTLPYAAPESINSRVVADFRADVFSLSVVAYELLTLEIPYDGLGGRVTSLSHQSKRLVPPRELLPSRQGKIPSSAAKLLDDYFQSALHPLPDYRFATRSDWLSSLDRLHFALQKGNRLRPWEETLLSCFEFLVRFGRRKQGQA